MRCRCLEPHYSRCVKAATRTGKLPPDEVEEKCRKRWCVCYDESSQEPGQPTPERTIVV